jgi:hypothetical protein
MTRTLGVRVLVVVKFPRGRWHTLNPRATLRSDRIDAPCIVDLPSNGEGFAPTSNQRSFQHCSHATSSTSKLGGHKGKRWMCQYPCDRVDRHQRLASAGEARRLHPSERISPSAKHFRERVPSELANQHRNASLRFPKPLPSRSASDLANSGHFNVTQSRAGSAPRSAALQSGSNP